MPLHELDAHRRSAQTRSGEISYVDTGTGPVAVFVHGLVNVINTWPLDRLTAFLAKNRG